MNLRPHGLITQDRPRWFTTAFWMVVLASVYCYLLIKNWEWWLLFVALGAATNYCWWRVRQTQKLDTLWGVTCSLTVVALLTAAGWALVTPFSVATESVGDNRVVCGSLVNPADGAELIETDGTSGKPVVRDRPIPESEFKRVCANRATYRTGDVVGAGATALMFALRAAGHLVGRRDTSGPPTAGRQDR
jgi:hypothetical protein